MHSGKGNLKPDRSLILLVDIDSRQTWIWANQSSFGNGLHHRQCWTHNLRCFSFFFVVLWQDVVATVDTLWDFMDTVCFLSNASAILKWSRACHLQPHSFRGTQVLGENCWEDCHLLASKISVIQFVLLVSLIFQTNIFQHWSNTFTYCSFDNQ